jgi:hypothetical protein
VEQGVFMLSDVGLEEDIGLEWLEFVLLLVLSGEVFPPFSEIN